LYFSGVKRAKRFGTFMVSSYGSLGAEQLHPLSFHTTLLTFGPIAPEGNVVVKLVYDHRVMDGRTVASCLADLDEVLHTAVLEELRTSGRQAA
jgi:pyruvate/2-oxoglutarate dehydrogenase complex dihydrolipoamide acyltransferase (E2) component